MTTTTTAAPAADAQNAPAPALGQEGFTPHPHAEDDELAQLEADAAKAPAQRDEPATPAEAPAASAADPAAPPEGDQPRDENGRWIPKARFDEAVSKERERSEKAIAAAAYYKGQLDAKGAGKPEDAAPTPEQEAQQLEAAIEQKAQDFDEGRIGLAEFKRFERQANQRLAVLQQPAERPDTHQDMTLEERTAELPGRFPVLAQIDGATFLALQPMAENQLLREGVKLDTGPWSSFKIRERMALIAQKNYGPPSPEASEGSAQPQPSTPTGRQGAIGSHPVDPTKAARDKLALAGRMPPNLNKSGTAQVPQDRHSLQSVAAMDLDEMATAVPESVLRKLSGQ